MAVRDRLDVEILSALQANGRASMAEIGERVGLSASAVTRRIERLEHEGVILGYSAQLNHKAVNLKVTAFVTVTLVRQSDEIIEAFERAAIGFREVAEVHLLAGSSDYLLRVVAPDIEVYEAFLKTRLTRLPGVAHVRTAFSLSNLKAASAMSLAHLQASSES
jgi:Lrp/AsnC family leucine-responsive transcriptional regulator